MKPALLLLALASSLHAAPETYAVGGSGKGTFPTIQQAVDAAVAKGAPACRITLAPGTYREKILLPDQAGDVTLEGKDAATTRIVFNTAANTPKADGTPTGTTDSATLTLRCPSIHARGITFENDFGQGSQALAMNLSSARGEFRDCRFLGWQDTLLVNSGSHAFENCHIEGHVDFIFGAGAAWFHDCRLHAKSAGYLTAASTPESQPFGYVFDHCRVTVDELKKGTVYLGRPWRPFASVIWLNCEMGKGIAPAGWENWRNPENEKTARYAEFRSTGEGGKSDKRVPWSKQLDPATAATITPEKVLGWTPSR